MSILVTSVLDFGSGRRITGLAASNANGQPVVHEQLLAAIEGIAWKDSVRVASVANVTLTAPGVAIDGITLANGDRVMLKNQTTTSQNGLYIFNGSATPMTRALDASTSDELEGAVVNVEEGTNAGVQYRQTAVNFTIDSGAVAWTPMGSSAPSASETTQGVAEIATQGETDTGTDDLRFLTPLKAKTASWAFKKMATNIGDAAATSIVVTHNFNTKDVQVGVFEVGGSFREILVETQHTSVNSVTLIFDTAPTLNQYRVVVQG